MHYRSTREVGGINMGFKNSFVWFNNHINVNSIKIDKLEKTANQEGDPIVVIPPFRDVAH
jgi:hypothetical protein